MRLADSTNDRLVTSCHVIMVVMATPGLSDHDCHGHIVVVVIMATM